MFVLTKSCISSTLSSSCSFAPSTERSHLESDLQMVRWVVELDCMIVVARHTPTILDSRRVAVASFVADRCYMEDTSNPCSSKILATYAWDYYNQGY